MSLFFGQPVISLIICRAYIIRKRLFFCKKPVIKAVEIYFSTKIEALHCACFPVNFRSFYHKQYGMVAFGHSVKYSYCHTFGQLYFWKSYFFSVFESNFFQSITRVTISERLFLQSRYLFRGAPFSKQLLFSSIFSPRISTCSERNFYPGTKP